MQKHLPSTEGPSHDQEGAPSPRRAALARKTLAFAIAVALTGIVVGLLGQQATPASAAQVAAQCNGEMNGGGTEVACTTTVVNYLNANGSLAATPPSTLTMTRCVGATGPLNTLTCTTTVDTLTEPVATVQQCNGSGNGGGGAVVCTTTVTNNFIGAPAPLTAASVYQCVGSTISGPGAPGICLPENTDGITTVAEATVGQCNGSGNGGTIVAFSCIVTAGSTTTPTLSTNVDQCNGSGNGGGAVVTCQATVVNNVIPPSTPPAATATAAAAATSTAVAAATLTPVPPATATAIAQATSTAIAAATLTPVPPATATAIAQATSTAIAAATLTPVAPATSTAIA